MCLYFRKLLYNEIFNRKIPKNQWNDSYETENFIQPQLFISYGIYIENIQYGFWMMIRITETIHFNLATVKIDYEEQLFA